LIRQKEDKSGQQAPRAAAVLLRNTGVWKEAISFIYFQVGQGSEVWASTQHGGGCVHRSYRAARPKLSFRPSQYSSRGSVEEEDKTSLGKGCGDGNASKGGQGDKLSGNQV